MSDNEYTPSTEEISESYQVRGRLSEVEADDEKGWQAQERRAGEFDRWLERERREVRESALARIRQEANDYLAAPPGSLASVRSVGEMLVAVLNEIES